MNFNVTSLSRVTALGIPAILGLGVAWLGVRIISNERNLKERKVELELQFGAKSLKGL
tara:strand:- start:533 stop:706 length:174 start_codon:yes stop_codon:yes gene_type:complete